ncbi:unnamed protein product [Heterobilharzia americana]|nr:unnamed protein product [Heterobilharzia americana]
MSLIANSLLSLLYAIVSALSFLFYFQACADPGNVGGEVSDEFHIPSSVGEDKILACPECNLNMNADLRGNDTQSKCTLESCPKVFQQVQAVEVAHCFLLGERYSKCFDATYQSTTGPKLLFMGCYGLGISRLLAVCIEHFTRASFPDKSAEKITQLRWPVQIAPYCGAIVFQKLSLSRTDTDGDLINGYYFVRVTILLHMKIYFVVKILRLLCPPLKW